MRVHMAQNWAAAGGGVLSGNSYTVQIMEAYQKFARRKAPLGVTCAVAP